jgi:hypothetical protein
MERNTPLSCKKPILRDTVRTSMESYGVPWRGIFAMTRDARLPALHRGAFRLRGRASLPGICAGSGTAGSRVSRGKRLRAAAGTPRLARIQDRLENTPSTSEAANELL